MQFDFRGLPAAHRAPRTYWFVMDRPDVDLCIIEPGYEVDLFVNADLAAFARVWLGEIPIRSAIRNGAVSLSGERQAVRDFPSWLLLSTLAEVPRPGESIQRRVA